MRISKNVVFDLIKLASPFFFFILIYLSWVKKFAFRFLKGNCWGCVNDEFLAEKDKHHAKQLSIFLAQIWYLDLNFSDDFRILILMNDFLGF